MGTAAERYPGRARHRACDGVRRRQAVRWRPALDQAHTTCGHPARRRQDRPPAALYVPGRYARFGDSPIVDRFVYENPHPDWVVLVEETIIKAVNFLRGTPERGGVVVVNSVRDPDYLLKFLPGEMKAKLAKFVVVDAVGLAEQREQSPWMFVRNLSELALDRMSTEGAEERLAIGMGIAAPLIGALVAATGELPVDAVADVVADRDAMLRGVAHHTVIDFAATARRAG